MNETPKKSAPVKARLPRGLADRGPAEIAATNRMIEKIREAYELYGFEAVETPFIEYTEALGKFLPDQDRPNEGVFSFLDDDESWLSLRYDLTAPLARYVAENFERLAKPYRSYRAGWVFRNEKPGPGRFRQFMQFDADTVGAASPAADAEMCMMAADTLERLGIKRGDYVIKVNNRKVLDGVLETIGLSGDENAGRRLTVLRAVDKLDRLGPSGVFQLMTDGRRDESGDVTKGAGLDFSQALRVMQLLGYNTGGQANLPVYEQWMAPTKQQMDYGAKLYAELSPISLEGVQELREIENIVRASEYGEDRIRIDPSVVRGLEYYTGPVFEAELLIDVRNDQGHPVRFGSVGGGGRYDGLVARFRGEPVPATGFSIGVSRLLSALKAVGSPIAEAEDRRGPVVVLVMDKGEIAHYQTLVARLRAAGIRSELYLGAAGMNAQLKYADRRGSVCAVIQGSNERQAAGGAQVTIRDLVLGAELAAASKDRADYLELRQRAQFLVAEDVLVAAVAEVLGRYGR
jgi:histidyl-tRNA synthetase